MYGLVPKTKRYEMHISECRQSSTTILTKCSKMTEEKHKRHGMNGNADGGLKDETSKTNYTQGGRLKFFKDGKFILELERAREGERMSWVSVPRKTFWPPQGTAVSTPTYRQESSTSLSVSDDNSSIQSSPWQRDHSWKQPSPRRNQSREMIFYFWRPKHKRFSKSKKQRRPYSTETEELKLKLCTNNSNTTNSNNNERTSPKQDSVCNKIVNTSSTIIRKRVSLLEIVQNLIDKQSISTTNSGTGSTPPPPRTDQVVSPRKRFLREMEKDNKTQVEDGCQKRSRNKTTPQMNNSVIGSGCSSSGSGGNSVPTIVKVSSPVRLNGTTTTPATTTTINNEEIAVKPARNCSSYSITSLLAEDRNVNKRSPSNSPSHFNNSVTQPQYCSPSSEDRCVDRLRSMELSQPDKSGYSPYPHPSYLPPYMYQYPLPPYYGPSVYGRGYIVPPVYHAPPMPIAVRHDVPSCSWSIEPPREPSEHREDNVTDMPLNLSKHAG